MTGAGNGPIAPSTSAALNAGPVLSPARIELREAGGRQAGRKP